MLKKITITILFSIFYFLFSATPTLAERVFFEPETATFKVNQIFEVSLFLNTEDESINALEGKIVFPINLLELREIRNGNSIVNFWIERPEKEQTGEIVFSGIIPGGYNARRGLIFSMIFMAKMEGTGFIGIKEIKLLRNDEESTVLNVSILRLLFNVAGQIPLSEVSFPEIIDKDPPESFQPLVSQSQDMFEGKYFLVFATQDKGSGIGHYEVLESRKQKIENRKWETAESPYLLKDQILESYIYVKAVDKQGNERIEIIRPQKIARWYEITFWSIIILGAVLGYLLEKKRKRKK